MTTTTKHCLGIYEAKASDGCIYSLYVWSDGSADVYADDASGETVWMDGYEPGYDFRAEPRLPARIAARFAAARRTIIENS
jgi:hypothetical protein